MQKSRLHPGVALLSDYIYLFAGETVTCERYSLRTAQWSPIADYPLAGSRIATCVYREKVYTIAEYCKQVCVYCAAQGWLPIIDLKTPLKDSFHTGDSEFVSFSDYSACKWQISDKTAGNPCKAEGLMLLFHDWTRKGGHVNALACCLGAVQWDKRVFVLLDNFGSGDGNNLGVFDIYGHRVETIAVE